MTSQADDNGDHRPLSERVRELDPQSAADRLENLSDTQIARTLSELGPGHAIDILTKFSAQRRARIAAATGSGEGEQWLEGLALSRRQRRPLGGICAGDFLAGDAGRRCDRSDARARQTSAHHLYLCDRRGREARRRRHLSRIVVCATESNDRRRHGSQSVLSASRNQSGGCDARSGYAPLSGLSRLRRFRSLDRPGARSGVVRTTGLRNQRAGRFAGRCRERGTNVDAVAACAEVPASVAAIEFVDGVHRRQRRRTFSRHGESHRVCSPFSFRCCRGNAATRVVRRSPLRCADSPSTNCAPAPEKNSC